MEKEVDEYFEAKLINEDGKLREAREVGLAKGLPAHEVSPTQGMLLQLLAESINATRCLEIGTLAGYSTIWLGRVAEVVSLEVDEERAAIARTNVARAGLGEDRVKIIVGPAVETLRRLDDPFDLIFIDADKPSNPIYFREALRLSRKGTLIIADNVVRDGRVIDANSDDPRVQGVRAFVDLVQQEPRVKATALQTVGRKGWDGFMLLSVVS